MTAPGGASTVGASLVKFIEFEDKPFAVGADGSVFQMFAKRDASRGYILVEEVESCSRCMDIKLKGSTITEEEAKKLL
jgi:hypothetical protein